MRPDTRFRVWMAMFMAWQVTDAVVHSDGIAWVCAGITFLGLLGGVE